MGNLPLFLGAGAGVLAAVFAAFLVMRINKLPAGNEKMQEIAGAIQEGAMAYLARQYRTVAVVAVVLAIAIAIPGFFGVTGFGIWTAIGFLLGGAASAAAGFIGMGISVRANVRTAEAARSGLGKALVALGVLAGMAVLHSRRCLLHVAGDSSSQSVCAHFSESRNCDRRFHRRIEAGDS